MAIDDLCLLSRPERKFTRATLDNPPAGLKCYGLILTTSHRTSSRRFRIVKNDVLVLQRLGKGLPTQLIATNGNESSAFVLHHNHRIYGERFLVWTQVHVD